jgi:DNA-binding NarL/FixJ family response regulator
MRANAVQTTAVQTTGMGIGGPVARRPAADSPALVSAAPAGQLSVLICDDRPDVRRELSRVFQLRSQGPVESVGAGSDLLQTYETRSPIQVMIGVHPGSTFGVDALDLLLARHPTASPVVYGSRRDVEFLASVYARGAAGLLLWEIGDH